MINETKAGVDGRGPAGTPVSLTLSVPLGIIELLKIITQST